MIPAARCSCLDNEDDSKRSSAPCEQVDNLEVAKASEAERSKKEAEADALAFDDDNNKSIFSGNFQHSINNENKSNSSQQQARAEDQESADSAASEENGIIVDQAALKYRTCDQQLQESSKRRTSLNVHCFKGTAQKGHFKDVFEANDDAALDQQASHVETSSSKVATGHFLAKTKKDYNRFSLNEIASKGQHLARIESEEAAVDLEEADAVRSNFSTEAQPNQQREYNSSHLQKYNDLSSKINRFSQFSDTLNKIKNNKTKSVLAGRSQGGRESSSNRSNSSRICSSLDPNDIDGLEQRVSNDLLQLEKMISKQFNLEKRIGSQMMNMG